MNHRVTGTTQTQEQSSQWKSASFPRLKKARQVKSDVKKTYWFASWTSKGSSTLNSYHKFRLLTSSSTLKCSSDCVMFCEESVPNFGGQVSGFCITTMSLFTQHWVCGRFLWIGFAPPTPHSRYPAKFSCSHEWRGTLKEGFFRM